MIRVSITKAGFIRKGPGRSYAATDVVYPSRKELVMDGVEAGEDWQGNNQWYYRVTPNKEKQYIWAGNATPVGSTTDAPDVAGSTPAESTTDAADVPGSTPADAPGTAIDATVAGVRVTSPIIASLGIDQIWADGESGDLAKVAILDSGIALNCPDLTQAIGTVPRNGTAPMKNFLQNSPSMDDDYGHGSHCAGLIAARNRQHVVGVAPASQLYVGKIRDARTNVSIPTLLEGIRWAAGLEPDSPQDIDIISISHGSLLNRPDMQPVINQALAKNKILVCAIGNRAPGGVPTGGFFPAVLPGVIAVGAVDLQHNFLSFNYEFDRLTICCPGENIFSYGVQGVLEQQSGTSQATAICAGVIALLVSRLKKRRATNIPQTIMRLLLSSESRTTDNHYRYRFLNAIKLYRTIH